MKIRNGFVSNSSSSSFIVAFDKYPENADDMRKLLFGDKETIDSPWKDDDYNIPTQWAAEYIFNSLKEVNVADGVSIVNSGYHEDYPEITYENWKDDDKWERIIKTAKERGEALWNRFMEKNKGKRFFVAEFSDNETKEEALLEHGDIFNKVSHLTISHH